MVSILGRSSGRFMLSCFPFPREQHQLFLLVLFLTLFLLLHGAPLESRLDQALRGGDLAQITNFLGPDYELLGPDYELGRVDLGFFSVRF